MSYKFTKSYLYSEGVSSLTILKQFALIKYWRDEKKRIDIYFAVLFSIDYIII